MTRQEIATIVAAADILDRHDSDPLHITGPRARCRPSETGATVFLGVVGPELADAIRQVAHAEGLRLDLEARKRIADETTSR